MIGAAGEATLPRRAVHQPQPHIYPQGDCGACSLGGAIGLTVPEVYARFEPRGGGITNGGEMERCLRCCVSYGLADRMLDCPAEFPNARYLSAFGSPAIHEYTQWFNYVRMAIDAGYYGIANVDYDGNGGPDTNHWVLICGARTEGAIVGKMLTGEILVSCPASGERWQEARDFLKRMGGYDIRFVRPIEARS